MALLGLSYSFSFQFVPALIIISGERAKEKRESLKGEDFKKEDLANDTLRERCRDLTKHIEETKQALLTFKRNELSLELVIQQSITLTMLHWWGFEWAAEGRPFRRAFNIYSWKS